MISFSECVVDIYMIKGRQQISNEYDLDFNITKGQIYKQYGAVVAGTRFWLKICWELTVIVLLAGEGWDSNSNWQQIIEH